MSFTIEDYRSSLNEQQFDAVIHRGGPLLVQAGPGTGKTRVLSYRIAGLVRSADNADLKRKVLAITFTNKAAAEIADRVAGLADMEDGGHRIQVATFHSWAFSFLKDHIGEQAREIVNEADARSILSEALKSAGVPGDARRIHSIISRAKQHWPVKTPEGEPKFPTYYKVYEAALEEYGLWDFDDLILEAARLLEDREIAETFMSQTQEVLVDEFQDVSPAQYALLRLMTGDHGDVTAIGDINQAIYGFRGASPQFMQKFTSDFRDVKQITLNEAYRCPQTFLNAARAVMGRDRAPKLVSCRGPGPEIIFKPHKDPGAEARWIALEIEKAVGALSFDSFNSGRAGWEEVRSLADVAVLFRTRRIGEMVAKALFEEGIPYQLSAMPDPLDQPEIRNIWRLWEAVKGRSADYHLSRLPGRKEKWIRKGNVLKASAAKLSPDQLVGAIAQALEIDTELPEVAGLMEAAARNPGIDSLTVLLRDEVEIIRGRTEAVSLLSLHAAKGLEFPVVFIAGCDEGSIPWKGSSIDEETRLFYVGLTRASEKLHVSYPRKRRINGTMKSRRPSRFIKKIPEKLRVTPAAKRPSPKRTMKQRQKSLF